MALRFVLFAALVSDARAAPGCYVHPGGCDCTVSEGCCTGTWYANCGCDGPNVNDTAGYAGCASAYTGGTQKYACDCEYTQQGCVAAEGENYPQWIDGNYALSGMPAYTCLSCNASESTNADGTLDDEQCGRTFSPPPSPPKLCEALPGSSMPKTTAESPDPVNEPCYSHSSCGVYSTQETGGYVCCVKRGTCDHTVDPDDGTWNTCPDDCPDAECDTTTKPGESVCPNGPVPPQAAVSDSADYYVGGCKGINYNFYDSSFIHADSVYQESDTGVFDSVATAPLGFAPSVVEGCAKQGECVLPWVEQYKDWTAGGGLSAEPIPDAVMDIMLTGSTSEHKHLGSCETIYPKWEVAEPNYVVAVVVEAAGSAVDYTETIVDEMEASVAAELGIATGNVEITVADAARRARARSLSGGVILTITVGYPTAETAEAGVAAMATNMATPEAMATVLSTSSMQVTVTAVPDEIAVQAPSDDDDGLSTGAVIGIAIGGAVVALVLVFVVAKATCLKPASTSVKVAPPA